MQESSHKSSPDSAEPRRKLTDRIKQDILVGLLRPVLQKHVQKDVPRSGEQGRKQNSFQVFFMEDGRRELWIQKIDNQGLHGKRYDGNSFIIPDSLHFWQIRASDISIMHFWGRETVIYNGLWDYVLNYKTGIQYLRIHTYNFWYRVSKFFFNKRKMVTKQRMELLRIMVDVHASERGADIGIIDLMTRLFSIKWVEHPDADNEQHKIQLYLDSLVASNDLDKNKARYTVAPKALLTLEQYELDERRHNNQLRLQRAMIWLTLLLALSAIVQARIIIIPTVLDLSHLFTW